ncbi:uncharacterized protein EV420DRAFT_1754593 [Desarmillaria tabescens]|uniref:Uncharacterized protein n=1 Tax=Armillaria tabescens TaxID=1929756 RepID=A0AA39J122_ARMTA|nr:uncharacterized protein EV420DRAFT_1754593 [Desarmillaria tabescens]KAK0434170.1 hypothetical protein EV420DRAFT_1754593 [Desarmillaria tabescens]
MSGIKKRWCISSIKKLFFRSIDIFRRHRRTCRCLYEGAVYPGLDERMEKIQSQIKPLEELERNLAKQYGMGRDFDPVEVFDKGKRLAFSNRDQEVLKKLGELHEFRLQACKA